ncbi:MAG: pyridoxal-phosphate dependent enzyme, partial [candidate division NC10 bacterium]
MWRYRAMIGLPEGAVPVSLGEGMTPLVAADLGGTRVLFKLEYLAPTGAFKDRGTSVLVSALTAWGVGRAADDSSGNAGASFAAYAAHAGIAAEVFAPAHASPAKLAQIEVYGATLNRIEGVREKTTEALEAATASGLVYASHAWSPFTLEGTKTIAYELWEQLTGRVGGAAAPVLDRVRLGGRNRHIRLCCVRMRDVTDRRNTLVTEEHLLPYTHRTLLAGSLLLAGDLLDAERGLFLLKEGPSTDVQLANPGFDFAVGADGLEVAGIGLDPADVRADEWTRGYGAVVGLAAARPEAVLEA